MYHNYVMSNIADGRKVVVSAGTPVSLVSLRACRTLIITAEANNTGVIVVGSSTVIADLATRRGVPLNPGDSVCLNVRRPNEVYIDSTVSGDGVTFVYLTN